MRIRKQYYSLHLFYKIDDACINKNSFIKHLKNEKGTGESPFRDKVLVIETLSLEVYLLTTVR